MHHAPSWKSVLTLVKSASNPQPVVSVSNPGLVIRLATVEGDTEDEGEVEVEGDIEADGDMEALGLLDADGLIEADELDDGLLEADGESEAEGDIEAEGDLEAEEEDDGDREADPSVGPNATTMEAKSLAADVHCNDAAPALATALSETFDLKAPALVTSMRLF
jgi:hypothetical protein